ncbi:MAG: hypothetical protein L6R39_000352 [Caloplaca ligustica]|nr:MAG: hypothetical protein L6R39_000352 [Caloplaca ligustica]
MLFFNRKVFCLSVFTPWAPLFADAAPAVRPFDEVLQAQGLLGSHFGQVDIPASYDYVVIGGGTAGLTIARRLAESHSVAVIEAGSLYELDNGNFTEIPADASYYLGKDPKLYNPLIDWRQKTTPQPGFGGASVYYPQGRTLGGSSTRNFMWYQRGSTGSYRMWADEVGDSSYTFSNLLPFFKKSVKFTGPDQRARAANALPKSDANAFSASGGPLQVSYPNFASPAASLLSRGLTAIGLKELPGMSSGNLLGWTWITETINPATQVRSTSESAFLREALQLNGNLITYRNTLAKKILFDGDKRAVGVAVESGGLGSGSVAYTINATKEVIVSSGAFRSPQMLMASGIGPASTLKENGIDVLADRPGVGQNMWDHIFFGPSFEVNTLTHSSLGDPQFAAAAAQEYITTRTGMLTNVGGDLLGKDWTKWSLLCAPSNLSANCMALAFEKLPKGAVSNQTRSDLDKTFGLDWPDIEILSLDAYTGRLNDFLLGAPAVKNYTSICIAIIAPFSRGNVTISSSDTNVHPVVNPNWLGDPRDREIAIAAFKRAREVFQAREVQPLLVGPEAFPGDTVQTDEQILQVITSSSSTIHHAAGTNRMGKTNDPLAVVDSRGM